jgi:hypothetical protein
MRYASLEDNLREMEQTREAYWLRFPETSPTKLRWRALTVRHAFHVLPGETILELDLVASTARIDAPRQRAEELERQALALARELDGYQRELEDLGIQLKDRRLGLVDFPSEMGGRPVLLCWRLGEPEVQFWHEVDAGFAGRQPLSPELVG